MTHQARQIDATAETRFCPACCDTYHPDDFAPASDYPATAPALIERYGSLPCGACTDDHTLCADCGEASPRAALTEIGDDLYCDNCVFGAERAHADEIRAYRDEIRAYRAAAI